MSKKFSVEWTAMGGMDIHTPAGHLFLDAEDAKKLEQSVMERQVAAARQKVYEHASKVTFDGPV